MLRLHTEFNRCRESSTITVATERILEILPASVDDGENKMSAAVNHLPTLIELHREYAQKGVQFLAIN